MEEKVYTFQIESTMFDTTMSEVDRIAPKWAKEKGKDLEAIIYINRKWEKYKVFKA